MNKDQIVRKHKFGKDVKNKYKENKWKSTIVQL